MIGQAGVLNVLVTASTGQANASLKRTATQFAATADAAEASAAKTNSAWSTVGARAATVLKGVSVAAVGIGAVAVKSAVDFKQEMEQVYTQAGATRGEVKKLSTQVLGLAKSSIFGPSELAKGLYHVESVGYRGAKAMQVLNAAQKMATVGNSDLESTTYALVSALHTGIQGTQNMTKTIATMDSIVGHGDMRMEDLTSALSTGILVSARGAGLSLKEAGGALDLFTRRGVPAQMAATRLRMGFNLLSAAAANDKASSALGDIGINADKLGKTLATPNTGLIDALQLIQSHLNGLGQQAQRDVIFKSFGGARTGTTIQTLLQNMGELKTLIGDPQKGINSSVSKFNQRLKAANDTPLNQLKQAWSQIQVMLVNMGNSILPVVVSSLTKAASIITSSKLSAQEKFSKIAQLAAHAFASLAPKVIEAGIAAGVAFTKGFADAFLHGNVIEKLFIASSFIYLVGGRAALLASGKAIGGMILRGFTSVMLATQMGARAYLFADEFAAAVGGAIPLAFAAVGVGNIVLSAVQGDVKGTAFKAVGAGIGAAIGAGLGFGLPGALVGGGLGSLVGGLFGGLFSSSSKATTAMDKVKQATHGVADAYKAVQGAVGGYKKSTDAVDKAHKTAHKTADNVKKAEQHYQDVLSHNLRTSMPAIKAEQQLKQATLAHARAIKQVHSAEKVEGAQKKFLIHELGFEYDKTKALNKQLKTQVRNLRNHFLAAQASGKSDSVLSRINDKWRKASQAQSNAQNRQNKLLVQAGQQVGPKFAKALEHGKTAAQNLGVSTHNLGSDFRVLNRSSTPLINEQQTWTQSLKKQKQAVDPLGNVYKKNLLDPFQRTQQVAPKASGDIQSLTGKIQDLGNKTPPSTHKASQSVGSLQNAIGTFQQKSSSNITQYLQIFGSSMGAQAQDFNQIAKGLGGGVSPIKYKASRPTGHQRGGFVDVPGHGVGDKVPLHVGGQHVANVEPGEKVGVVHRTAARMVDQINKQYSRFGPQGFRKGGTVQLEPGVNMSMGQEPAILKALRGFAGEEGKTVYVISGYRSPAHSVAVGGFANDPHTQGKAADIGLGSPTLSSMMSMGLDSPLRNVGLYRPFYPPSSAEANHVQLLNGAAGIGGVMVAPTIKRILMQGPAGALLTAGQRGLDKSRKAMDAYIKKHMPALGGVGYISGGGGPVMAQIYAALHPRGWNKVGAAGVIGNAVGESNLDPGAIGTGGGGLWGFTAGAISLASLQSFAKSQSKPWTDVGLQTQFMLAHGGQGLMPAMNRQGSAAASAAYFMNNWEHPGIPRLDVRVAGAQKALAAGFKGGGILSMRSGGVIPGAIGEPQLILGHGQEEVVPVPQRNHGGGYTVLQPIVHTAAHLYGDAGSLIDDIEHTVDARIVEQNRGDAMEERRS